jgi:hypothetical protein
VHCSVLLKLHKCFICHAVSSKYLSAYIPTDLNVDKYCCENPTVLKTMLQYIIQIICHLTDYSITVTFYCWQNFGIKESIEFLWRGKPKRPQKPNSPNLRDNFFKILSGSTLKMMQFQPHLLLNTLLLVTLFLPQGTAFHNFKGAKFIAKQDIKTSKLA